MLNVSQKKTFNADYDCMSYVSISSVLNALCTFVSIRYKKSNDSFRGLAKFFTLQHEVDTDPPART